MADSPEKSFGAALNEYSAKHFEELRIHEVNLAFEDFRHRPVFVSDV